MNIFGRKKTTPSQTLHLFAKDSSSAAAESFYSAKLAITVSFPVLPESNGRVITVVSPADRDGKTTVAVNLAMTLTQAGARVLLLDADMKKGEVAKYFGEENKLGLSDYIYGRATTDEIIRCCPKEKLLSYISCGTKTYRSYELLSRPRLTELLETLKTRFDYVIADTPALLSVSDGLLMASKSDATVLVCRYYGTKTRDIAKAMDALSFVKANVLGAIVNDYVKK